MKLWDRFQNWICGVPSDMGQDDDGWRRPVRRADYRALEDAVMNHLWAMPYQSQYCKSIERLEQELPEIAAARAWAESLTKLQGRYFYLKWLDYFKAGHLEEIKKLKFAQSDGEIARRHAEDRARQQRQERAMRLQGAIPAPPRHP